MKTSEVIEYLAGLEPEELKSVFSELSKRFSERAETLYDQNPDENGLLAQPYADISDLMEAASVVFDDVDNATIAEEQTTVLGVVNSPWRGR